MKLGVGTALTIYAFYVTYGLQINNCRNEDAAKTWRCIQHIQHMRVLSQYLTLRRLMSYIYGAPILDVSRSHTTTQHSR